MHSRVDYTLRSFRKNREIAEESLRRIRKDINFLRHGQAAAWMKFIPGLTWYLWRHYARISIRAANVTRRKIRMYKRVEAGLESGDLTLAIEALDMFCPEPESETQAIRRLSLGIFGGPDILRANMMRARDQLVQLQLLGEQS